MIAATTVVNVYDVKKETTVSRVLSDQFEPVSVYP
jgi:hypothetical protein